MTTDELYQAKKQGQPVKTPQGNGLVNGIGQTHTYIYFPERARITEFANDTLQEITA